MQQRIMVQLWKRSLNRDDGRINRLFLSIITEKLIDLGFVQIQTYKLGLGPKDWLLLGVMFLRFFSFQRVLRGV